MSLSFEAHLQEALSGLEATYLRRQLRQTHCQGVHLEWKGRKLLNFSSNDYLGLAGHPALREAAASAAREQGAGAGASRLVSGNHPLHESLDAAIATLKGTTAALSFSSGYAAALGCIPSIVGPGDAVILDKLSHACLVDAARLSRATMRIYRHNDPEQLESHLLWARNKGFKKILVVTESLFSMDGDVAPLREIVELKDRHGAWLMVDEAHATGLFGGKRGGLVQEAGLTERVEIQMGTLSKAVGASGGYIAGSVALRDFQVNRARSFVFSTGPALPAAAAALAGIELIQSKEGATRLAQLRLNVAGFCNSNDTGIPIQPVLMGGESAALEAARSLLEAGFWVPAIRYPTVPRGQARLRVTLSADHSPDMVRQLHSAMIILKS